MDNKIKKILVDNNISNTKSRRTILKILKENKKPKTAEQIFNIAKNEITDINLSTIYRNLNVFLKKDIVEEIGSNTELKGLYLYKNKEEDTHNHYLLCEKCGKMLEVEFCPLKELEDKLEKQYDFKVLKHKLKITGICNKC